MAQLSKGRCILGPHSNGRALARLSRPAGARRSGPAEYPDVSPLDTRPLVRRRVSAVCCAAARNVRDGRSA